VGDYVSKCMSDELRTVYPVVACPCVSEARYQHIRKTDEEDKSSCSPERRPVQAHKDNVAVNKMHIIQGRYCIA
jgi:hypothetical protein